MKRSYWLKLVGIVFIIEEWTHWLVESLIVDQRVDSALNTGVQGKPGKSGS